MASEQGRAHHRLLVAAEGRLDGLVNNAGYGVIGAGFAPPAIGYYIASKAALEVTCRALAIEAAADQRPARTRAYVRPHRRECAT